jgi:hypothetical protein
MALLEFFIFFGLFLPPPIKPFGSSSLCEQGWFERQIL